MSYKIIGKYIKDLDFKIPNSKIMFKSLRTNNESEKNITNSLISYGVDQKQIIFDGKSSLEKYFESYNKIDLVLDTFPFNGGATSHDAVWMGVPVLSLQGNIAYSRQGSCLNHHLNILDFLFSILSLEISIPNMKLKWA